MVYRPVTDAAKKYGPRAYQWGKEVAKQVIYDKVIKPTIDRYSDWRRKQPAPKPKDPQDWDIMRKR